MSESLKLGWSYNKIEKEKKTLLIKYAVSKNFRCPGHKCNNIFFKDLPQRNVHIGHRISQKWHSQNMGVVEIHHPYNLYLTCGPCNISLSYKYPTEMDERINDMGTIGDWLMNDLLDIQSDGEKT